MILDNTLKTVAANVGKRFPTPTERLRFLGWLIAECGELPLNHRGVLENELNLLYGKVAGDGVNAGGWDFDHQKDAKALFFNTLRRDPREALRFGAYLLHATNFGKDSDSALRLVDALRAAFVATNTVKKVAA